MGVKEKQNRTEMKKGSWMSRKVEVYWDDLGGGVNMIKIHWIRFPRN